jgi:DNA polymerase IV
MHRKIIHVDLDAFFCAVEELSNPSLRGKPFAVGGKPDERGVVASCSYPARKFGIRSAMPMARVLRLCPNLIIIPANHREYSTISRNIFVRLNQITEQIEQISIDEAFLDVSDSTQPPEEIAVEVQKIIQDEFGLSSSLGVASNKLVAKIATNVGKSSHRADSPPHAITVVAPGGEAEFLDPLPVEALWGVGPKTAAKLEQLGIFTIGTIARWPYEDLVRRFGKHGEMLSKFAAGIDTSPITTTHEIKSISQETTFIKDIRDKKFIETTIKSLSESIAHQLRKSNLVGSTVKIKLRWTDFTTLTRQTTLGKPTNDSNEIYIHSIKLLDNNWDGKAPIRLVGVGISNLASPKGQLSLWDASQEDQKVEKVIKELKDRFGDRIINQGINIRSNNEGREHTS